MNQITIATLKRAMVLLDAIGAKYAIIDSEGNKHGELETEGKRPKKYAHGEMTGHVRSWIKNLPIGGVSEVPIGKYEAGEIQRCIASFVCKEFGKGTHVTCISADRQSIQVLRVA